MPWRAIRSIAAVVLCLGLAGAAVATEPFRSTPFRGTGDLGIVVERAVGSVKIVETTGRTAIAKVDGLGDLSHASAVFSRDGAMHSSSAATAGSTKSICCRRSWSVVSSGRQRHRRRHLAGRCAGRGRQLRARRCECFDAGTLEKVAEIAAIAADGSRSKVVGLEDAGGDRFVFSLYDAGEIWIADLADRTRPEIKKFLGVGRQPYDALVTEDGRWYVAGLFGEDALVLLDLWRPEAGVRRILESYRKGEEQLPVYKMPHLEGWAKAGDLLFLPAVGRHELLVVDARDWRGRPHCRARPAGLRGRAPGWPAGLGQLRAPTERYRTGHRRAVARHHTNAHSGQGGDAPRVQPAQRARRISVRDEDRVDVYDAARFTRRPQFPPTSRAASSSPLAPTGRVLTMHGSDPTTTRCSTIFSAISR